MGLIRNLSITLLYELFLCKDSITFRVFYVGNKKLYDSINEHFDNSVNISDYGVVCIFCLEIFGSHSALSAFRNISYLLQIKFCLWIIISFAFSRNKAIISNKELAPYLEQLASDCH